MRKVVLITIAVFVAASVGWAQPCTAPLDLAGLINLGATGCTVSDNVVGSVSSNLGAQSTINIAAITSGSNAGGFTAGPITLTPNASNTFNFTLTPAAGASITDLSAELTGGTGGTLSLSLNNGSSLSAATNGSLSGLQTVNFGGVSSLGVTGTLSASASASGSTTITVAPSLGPARVTPEPATLVLFGTGLGVLLFLGFRRRLNSDAA